MNHKSFSLIQLATSSTEIEQCFVVMSQLRSNFKLDDFLQQAHQQIATGYKMAFISKDALVVGVVEIYFVPSDEELLHRL